jgi:ADP-heptose:LPS heptosyltransferase
MPLRKWPQERFVELGRRLLASDDRLHLAITGAPSEREAAVALAGAIGSSRAVSVAGRTTLYELMTLYTLADVLVTNDSGPGHFAALTGIDTVVLFGPETAARYGPLGPRCHVMSAGLACSPCVNAFNHRFSPCTINRCMLEITVDQVFEAVGACLAARRRA